MLVEATHQHGQAMRVERPCGSVVDVMSPRPALDQAVEGREQGAHLRGGITPITQCMGSPNRVGATEQRNLHCPFLQKAERREQGARLQGSITHITHTTQITQWNETTRLCWGTEQKEQAHFSPCLDMSRIMATCSKEEFRLILGEATSPGGLPPSTLQVIRSHHRHHRHHRHINP
jgi:hypothetical protein